MTTSFYQWQDDTLILSIQLQPRASRDEILDVHGEALKIRITAPPVDGKANKHLLKMLAKTFKVPVSKIRLLSGETSRYKRVAIENPVKLPPVIPAKK